jgi:dipeptidyl aminopeptidase/acylaminoacyl peptidase
MCISTTAFTAEALDIQYGTVLGESGSNILVQYYSIEKKKNFLCNTINRTCSTTKKTSLGTTTSLAIKDDVEDEIRDNDGGYLTLSPSKNLLAYFKASDAKNPNRSFIIRDLKTNEEHAITYSNPNSYWDLVNDQGRVFRFSPDSTKLIYLDDRDGTLALYLVDTTTLSGPTMTSVKLSTTAFQVDDFIFADNDTLYYVGNSKTNQYEWSLYRYNFKTKTDTVVASKVSYVDSLRKIGSMIIFNQMQAKGYGPAMYNTSTKKVVQFKTPGITTKNSTLNQTVIKAGDAPGILMTPAKVDSKKSYPLLIWLHGGPYRQTSYGYHPYHSYGIYDSILELLRKNNVMVLKLDYKGSFGFGRPYAEGIKGTVGEGDVKDVMDAITYAKSKYYISNVYVAGNSYGGYLSLRSIVEHPGSFTGVMSINGVTDWESLLLSIKTSIFNTHFNGLPDANNKALYDKASIVNRIGNLGDQKIAIIQGQADRTIAPWQADFLSEKLKAQNKNVSLVRYPGEGHVFRTKKTINDLCTQMFTFVGKSPDKECKK